MAMPRFPLTRRPGARDASKFGGYVPALPTTGLLVRHEVASGLTTVGGGGADTNDVSAWADGDAGAGPYNLTQSTSGNRPVYEATGGPSSTPTVAMGLQARGAQGCMTWTSALLASAGPMTLCVVLDPKTTTGDQRLFTCVSGPRIYLAESGNVRALSGGFSNFGASTTGPQVLTFGLASPTAWAYRGRTAMSAGASYTNTAMPANGWLGCGRFGSAQWVNADVAAAFLWSGELDATARTALWDYLAATYPDYIT